MYVCMYVCSSCSHLKHRACVKRFVSLQFLNLRQSLGFLGRGISPSQGRYLHRTTQTRNKRRQISMPWVGFEPTIPAFEREKIFYALDRAATVNGCVCVCVCVHKYIYFQFTLLGYNIFRSLPQILCFNNYENMISTQVTWIFTNSQRLISVFHIIHEMNWTINHLSERQGSNLPLSIQVRGTKDKSCQACNLHAWLIRIVCFK
jgi:hypothetical protein